MSSLTTPPDKLIFNGDAMLMYGWVSGPTLVVSWVNTALRNWIRRPHQLEHEEENKLENLLRRIDQPSTSEQEAQPPVSELLNLILHRDELGVGGEIERLLRYQKAAIDAKPYGQAKASLLAMAESRSGSRGDWKAVIISDWTDGACLVGVRAVNPSGFRLRGKDVRERVDLISVLQTRLEPVPGSSEPMVRVIGFQGQLQEAWERVYPVIREGTHSGELSLLGRNMSHTIGSHALAYAENDVDRTGTVANNPTNMKAFLGYLRERTEFLAGVAVALPLSPTVRSVDEIVDNFIRNKVLTTGICRSEGVDQLKIEVQPAGKRFDAVLPSGVLSEHAMFIILENIFRDAAKYGRSTAQMPARIIVEDPGPDSNLLRITVRVDGAEARDGAFVTKAQIALSTLRIADDAGRFIRGGWGIKERFIAAAHLRGLRARDLLPPSDAPTAEMYLRQRGAGPEPILSVEKQDGEPVWIFYMMKARGILVISDREQTHRLLEGRHDAVVKRLVEIENNGSAKGDHFRHIVVDPKDSADALRYRREASRLPVVAFMVADEQISETNPLLPVPRKSLPDLSVLMLRQIHLEWLRARGRFAETPTLVFVDGTFKLPEGSNGKLVFKEQKVVLLSHAKTLQEVAQAVPELRGPLCVYMRHWDPEIRNLIADVGAAEDRQGLFHLPGTGPIVHFEQHDENFWGGELRSLIGAHVINRLYRATDPRTVADRETLWASLEGAALTRILIVDERRAEFAAREPSTVKSNSQAPDQGVTQRELLRLKGIDVFTLPPKAQGAKLPWTDLWEALIVCLRAQKPQYEFVLLHLGIVDKVLDEQRPGGGSSDTAPGGADELARKQLMKTLQPLTHCLVIHTARMTGGASNRFLPYSTLTNWLDANISKMSIVEELNGLRGEVK